MLLSVVCCIALIHVELRIQEHHRLISSSVTYCAQMEKHILQKIQQNNKDWQITKGSHLAGQREQTTGKFVKDINDHVKFEPKGAVMAQYFFEPMCLMCHGSRIKYNQKYFMERKQFLVGNSIFLRFHLLTLLLLFLAIFQGPEVINSRQKRASPVKSQQKSVQTTSNVKMLIIRESCDCYRTKSVLKMKQFAAQDQKVTQDDEEGLVSEEDQVLQGDPGLRGLLVNMDQLDLKDQWV